MLPRTIVVATDFSETAERATRYGVELAAKLGARLVLVNAFVAPAVGSPELGPMLSAAVEQVAEDADRQLQTALTRHRSAGVEIEAVSRCSDAPDAVVRVAGEMKADLVVIGTHGRRGLSRALLGSVSEAVVRAAPCPVLVVR